MLIIKNAEFGRRPTTQWDIEQAIDSLNDASAKINEVLSEIAHAAGVLPASVFSYGDFKYPLEEIQGHLAVAEEKANEIKANYPADEFSEEEEF